MYQDRNSCSRCEAGTVYSGIGGNLTATISLPKSVIPPFFIRVLTWSTRGSVRSWAMDRTLLGPTGFSLGTQRHAGVKRAAWFQPESSPRSPPRTHHFSSATGGISIDRYSLKKTWRFDSRQTKPRCSRTLHENRPNEKLLMSQEKEPELTLGF